uniref:M15 family metallopeptidase n=1 Tax=Mycolicibacter minnesotensis TaxID=1118379 RepID=UPI0021F313B1
MRHVIAPLLVACGLAGAANGVAAASPDQPIPPVSDAARAVCDAEQLRRGADVSRRRTVPGPNNFVGVQMYPADARCLVDESMAAGLATAADTLRPGGDVLVFWDCYRPH